MDIMAIEQKINMPNIMSIKHSSHQNPLVYNSIAFDVKKIVCLNVIENKKNLSQAIRNGTAITA